MTMMVSSGHLEILDWLVLEEPKILGNWNQRNICRKIAVNRFLADKGLNTQGYRWSTQLSTHVIEESMIYHMSIRAFLTTMLFFFLANAISCSGHILFKKLVYMRLPIEMVIRLHPEATKQLNTEKSPLLYHMLPSASDGHLFWKEYMTLKIHQCGFFLHLVSLPKSTRNQKPSFSHCTKNPSHLDSLNLFPRANEQYILYPS